MALHRVYFDGELSPGPLSIGGDEAHHAARVKRLNQGDAVQVLDGRGGIGDAVLAATRKDGRGWNLEFEVRSVRQAEPVRPRVEVWSPAPKGARLTELIDGL